MKNPVSKELEKMEKERKFLEKRTQISKTSFIKEIKNGLGEEIKKDPKPIIHKPNRFKVFIKKLLNMF